MAQFQKKGKPEAIETFYRLFCTLNLANKTASRFKE